MGRINQMPDIMGEALGRFTLAKLSGQHSKVASLGRPRPLEKLIKELRSMRLAGMARALDGIRADPRAGEWSLAKCLDHLLKEEKKVRQVRGIKARLARAGLKNPARLEEIDYSPGRGIGREQMQELGSCGWVANRCNILITGGIGAGKTFVACALSRQACLAGFRVIYRRLPDLLLELDQARGQGCLSQALRRMARPDLLTIDDWGLHKLNPQGAADLMELLEASYQQGSLLIVSRLPLFQWDRVFGDETLAGAGIDRITASSFSIRLKGESRRARRDQE